METESEIITEGTDPVQEKHQLRGRNSMDANKGQPIIGATIRCFPKDDKPGLTAKVLSRAGKAGSLYRNCHNIQRNSGEVDKHFKRWQHVQDDEKILLLHPAPHS